MLADEPPRAFFAAAMKRISRYHDLMRKSSRSPPCEAKRFYRTNLKEHQRVAKEADE